MVSLGGPSIEVPPLNENLVEIVDLAQGAYPTTFELADTTPPDSTLAARKATS